MSAIEKLIRDGKVAVVIGRTRGDRFSTRHDIQPEACFDSRLALAVLGESDKTPSDVLDAHYPTACAFSYPNLMVEWVPEGQEFFVKESESSESVVYKDHVYWMTA